MIGAQQRQLSRTSGVRKKFSRMRMVEVPLHPPAYLPRPAGRFFWLQRAAHWLLRRYGQDAMMQQQIAESVDVPASGDLLQDIREEIGARIGWGNFRREDLVVVVGCEAEIDLIRATDELRIGIARPDRQHEVFGVPVYASSWLDGWMVLPRKVFIPGR